jgi:putative flippase GtrA
VGLVAGLVLNYLMSILWVFTACKRILKTKKGIEFVLFALVGIAGVGINQVLMYLMVDGLGVNEMVSKMIAAVLVLMWNFGARKLMLFRGKKTS